MYFRWRMNWSDVDEKMQMVIKWSAREKELQSKLAQLISHNLEKKMTQLDTN